MKNFLALLLVGSFLLLTVLNKPANCFDEDVFADDEDSLFSDAEEMTEEEMADEQEQADLEDGFCIINGKKAQASERFLGGIWNVIKKVGGALLRGPKDTGGPLCPGWKRPKTSAQDEEDSTRRRRRRQAEEVDMTEEEYFANITGTTGDHLSRGGEWSGSSSASRKVKYCRSHKVCFKVGKVCCPHRGMRRFVCRAPRYGLKQTSKGVLLTMPFDV